MRVAAALEGPLRGQADRNSEGRAEQASQRLGKTLVLAGDSTDESLLEQENIAEMDLFLAVTNDDENNIMSASLAKRMGCKARRRPSIGAPMQR